MTDFNLLPSEYQSKPFTLRHILLLCLLALLFLLIVKYGFLEPIQKKEQVLQQLDLIKGNTVEYSDLEEEQLQHLTQVKELEQRVLAFQEMEKGTPGFWQDVLNTIIKALPYNSRLNHFICDNNTFILSGTCMSDRTSAAYLRNLKKSSCFSEVHMEKIMYQDSEVRFTIRCILKFDTSGGIAP